MGAPAKKGVLNLPNLAIFLLSILENFVKIVDFVGPKALFRKILTIFLEKLLLKNAIKSKNLGI